MYFIWFCLCKSTDWRIDAKKQKKISRNFDANCTSWDIFRIRKSTNQLILHVVFVEQAISPNSKSASMQSTAFVLDVNATKINPIEINKMEILDFIFSAMTRSQIVWIKKYKQSIAWIEKFWKNGSCTCCCLGFKVCFFRKEISILILFWDFKMHSWATIPMKNFGKLTKSFISITWVICL